MELRAGSRLAHFEILGLLGAGGMGEVYRALDTKLKREVAIKVLPPNFAEQSDRLARFEQEAVLLASLNHPHVAAIYGVEHVEGVPCLVLELVEGPTLADRLLTGPIPVAEALRIAGQIADALDAAHEKGIVHRDLKPANVKLTTDGKVKVLDFGLAKAFAAESTQTGGTASTQARGHHTAAGVVMGTASYMSPEQAEGRPVDKRTDVWSFGVLLYEMLTGKRLFDGKSDAHVLVHVMEQEPDWAKLPPLPAGVQALMERCLQKDPTQRLRDIGDVRILLQASLSHPIRAVAARSTASPYRWVWPAVAAGVAVAALVLGALVWRRPAPVVPVDAVRFDIARPGAPSSPLIAISPDGRQLAFGVTRPDGSEQIWVRSMATQEARPLEGATSVQGLPFWSADSRYLVFSASGKVRKIDATGGPSQILGDVQTAVFGGFWSQDDKIVYADVALGAMQVPSSGGTPVPLPAGGGGGGNGLVTLSALPGGNFVYCACVGATREAGIYVATPGAGAPRKILPDVSLVQYAPSPRPDLGYVLFLRGGITPGDTGTLMAQPIDPRQLRLLGDPVAIAEQVRGFSASDTGVLVYSVDSSIVPGGIPGILRGQLTWFDRQGHVLSTVGEPGIYRILALSPDERLVALERADPGAQNIDIYLFEFARGVNNRFTFDPRRDVQPVWSPDGTQVLFARLDGGSSAWYRRAANLAGEEELLFRAADLGVLSAISPDGRFLLFTGPLPGPADIQAVDLSRVPEAREAIPVVSTTGFNEANARFSPDGRWFAYASDASGTTEIYVRPFNPSAAPGAPLSVGGQVLVSKGGATFGGAFWRRDGKELFYLAADGTVMSVAISTEPTFSVSGPPQALFKVPPNVLFFDVSRDGERFLIPVPEGAGASAPPYKVVLNWTSTLK